MSRVAPHLARSLASSSRATISPLALSRRTLIGDTKPRASDNVSGAVTSVDPRVLNGLPSFIPKNNVDYLCEWQTGLWNRLQDEIRSNPGLLEVKQKWDRTGLDMSYLLSHSSRDPKLALAFNYGSLLLNNSFFLESLHGEESPKEVPARFQSLAQKVEAYADGIVGGGWLWIVQNGDRQDQVDVFPTFASGTLLVTNRAQRGRADIPVFGTPESSEKSTSAEAKSAPEVESSLPAPEGLDHNKRLAGQLARNSSSEPIPLAVLNLFEISYLGDKYGVWGRKQYASDWFKSLDWNKVEGRAASAS